LVILWQYKKKTEGIPVKKMLEKIGYIARFLNYMELITPYVLKHIPRVKKIKRISARKAMPKHMLKHLVDILTNRPPKSKTCC